MTGILLSIVSGITFGIFQTVNRRAGRQANVYHSTFVLLLAGSSALLLISWRWIALDLSPIAVVISLSRLSIPTVLILSPLLIGQKFEQVNRRVWIGAIVIIIGALILTFS